MRPRDEWIREMAELHTKHKELSELECIRKNIQEFPISVRVRGDWYEITSTPDEPTEYEILLACGGPSHRIRGSLESMMPATAALEQQTWDKPWTPIPIDKKEYDAILWVARVIFDCDE